MLNMRPQTAVDIPFLFFLSFGICLVSQVAPPVSLLNVRNNPAITKPPIITVKTIYTTIFMGKKPVFANFILFISQTP